MTEPIHTLKLTDGRKLGWLRFGVPSGEPFFYFHGMPGSRYESLLIREQARALGLSIISVDRPGYGLSDFATDRSLLDWPNDVVALADKLGLDRFGIIGVSGGGPYALACARAIPERLTSTGIVCGLGPVYEQALLAEMSLFGRTAFGFERTFPRAFRMLYGWSLTALARTAPELAVRMLGLHCGGEDRRVLQRDDVRRNIAASLGESFRQGANAAALEMHLYRSPWGFNLGEISSEILLWHGTADRVVPVTHGEYIAARLPAARLARVNDAGHFSLPILYGERILGELKGHL